MVKLAEIPMKVAPSALLAVVLSISVLALPFSARACTVSKQAEIGCGCCVKKVCCSAGDKNNAPVTQPLANNSVGHEVWVCGASSHSINPQLFPNTSHPGLVSHTRAVAPPTCVFLCTFLI
jgi:hypothetical protein